MVDVDHCLRIWCRRLHRRATDLDVDLVVVIVVVVMVVVILAVHDVVLVGDVVASMFIVVVFAVGAVLRLPILDGVFICCLHVMAVYRITEVLARSLASLQTTFEASCWVSF